MARSRLLFHGKVWFYWMCRCEDRAGEGVWVEPHLIIVVVLLWLLVFGRCCLCSRLDTVWKMLVGVRYIYEALRL